MKRLTGFLKNYCMAKTKTGQKPHSPYYNLIVTTISQIINVRSAPHYLGPWGTEFTIQGQDIGHLHHVGIADIVFVEPIATALVTAKIARTNKWTKNAVTFVVKRVCRDARERFTPSLVQIDSHCATAN